MARTKTTPPVAEETTVEKMGHSVGHVIGAIKEKFNELVGNDNEPPVKKTRKAVTRPLLTAPAVKKPAAKKSAAPAAKKKITKAKK